MKDIDKDTLGEALARNTLDDIPQPKSDAKEIVGLVKSSGQTKRNTENEDEKQIFWIQHTGKNRWA